MLKEKSNKIKIGISSCLLGNKVRYDGQHKRDRYIVDILGKFAEFVPVCPEVECGMPIPREAVRLVGDLDKPRLITRSGKVDMTEKMQSWAKLRLKELEKEELCGFIFQKSSPSSGMTRIKVYPDDGMPVKKGVGIFARMFMDHFPLLPVEDDGRLHDPQLRENFIEKIFVQARWLDLMKAPSKAKLVTFQTDHKLLIMSHSPTILKDLGKIVANLKKETFDTQLQEYQTGLFSALALNATVKKHRNVLEHIMGYFKKQLSSDEKKELREVIVAYYEHLLPLIVPITLLNHYVRKFNEEYLQRQHYLHPHPAELALRNHV